MPKRVDITGRVYGKLTAIECLGKNPKGVEMWKCKCECGNEATIRKGDITSGQTKSCGCLKNAIKDIKGKVFGKLTVIEYVGQDQRNHAMWKCKCECGEETITRGSRLTSGQTKSCGCMRKEKVIGDLTGRVFGRLTAIEYVGSDEAGKASVWKCRCECGNETSVRRGSLISGATLSCGCLNKEIAPTKNLKHGLYKHHLYSTWNRMRQRCNNPKDEVYENYGGRGIKVCDEWNNSFEAFHRDMASTHRKGLTLERKDVNGDYSPENCVWATRDEQANNKRTTVYITVFGETMSISQAAKKYKMNRDILVYRLNRGDTPEDAVTTPVKKYNKGKRK